MGSKPFYIKDNNFCLQITSAGRKRKEGTQYGNWCFLTSMFHWQVYQRLFQFSSHKRKISQCLAHCLCVISTGDTFGSPSLVPFSGSVSIQSSCHSVKSRLIIPSGTLLAMLITWLATGRPKYESQEGKIAYISDVGASYLKPLFIVGCCITAVCFVSTLLVAQWLKSHSGRYVISTSAPFIVR